MSGLRRPRPLAVCGRGASPCSGGCSGEKMSRGDRQCSPYRLDGDVTLYCCLDYLLGELLHLVVDGATGRSVVDRMDSVDGYLFFKFDISRIVHSVFVFRDS